MDPNTLLDNSSPRVAEMTPELHSLLDEMVTANRPQPRRLRAVPLAASGLVAAAALGVAGTAAAAIVMHYTNANVPDATESGHFSWTSAAGHACTLQVDAGPRADSDRNYSDAQAAALSATHDWIASFDVSTIDISSAEASWLRGMERSQIGNPASADGKWSASELARRFTGDELEKYAVVDAVNHDLSSYLESRGYNLRSLTHGFGAVCDR